MRDRTFLRKIDRVHAEDLVRKYRRGKYAPRAVFLLTLIRAPETPTAELASTVGRCVATINRYLATLEKDGVEGLFPVHSKACKLTFEQRQQLESEVRRGRFRSYSEMTIWLRETFDITYSVPGIRALLANRLPVDRHLLTSCTDPENGTVVTSDVQINRLTSFLNQLPLALEWQEWCAGFRRALQDLFPEITYCVVTLNRSSRLDGTPAPNVGIHYLEFQGEKKVQSQNKGSTLNNQHESFLTLLEERLTAEGHDLDSYFSPIYFEANLGEGNLLGRIIIYINRTENDPRPLLSRWLEIHRPFLTFCLSDGIARSAMATPHIHELTIGINRIAARYTLTPRELEVLTLYVTGSSSQEIADTLTLSPATVRNHISSIHRKTGTRHQREIFRLVHTIGPGRSIEKST